MATRRSAPQPAADAPEIDRVAGLPHPRETPELVGQDAALAIAARAIRGGHSPQGWLICGPPGIGKATIAYRILRYLLAYGATDRGPVDLSLPSNDPVAQLVAAGAHPGMMVIRRGLNDRGKPMTVLGVDEVRRLHNFFGMTSGAGGWRVAIIDTADDMNDQAANALLKMLEEPPPRAMLLLVANQPGRLLPTIRSRCQRLALELLRPGDMCALVSRILPDLEQDAIEALVRLADGSPGVALRLAGGEGASLAADATRLIDNATQPDVVGLFALADRITKMEDGFGAFSDFLLSGLTGRIRARARGGNGDLNAWADSLSRLDAMLSRTRGLHLEPRQTILSAAGELARVSSRHGRL